MASPRPHVDPDVIDDLNIPYTVHEPLGPKTWYGVGGPADVFVRPRNEDDLSRLLNRCAEAQVPVYTLGSGANLLVADDGVRGVVIRLDADRFSEVQRVNSHVSAGAGADLAKLVLTTAKLGLAGLEVLAGIPASIGGALRMNCGGKYGSIGPTVHSATVASMTGDVVTLEAADLKFDYRSSNLDAWTVISATFELAEQDPIELRERVKEVFAWKKSTQPLAEQSAGCAFKNPPAEATDKSAGRLIDEAGLKGFAVGGAEVSTRHANFVTLKQGGSASDVLRLIRAVKQRVADHSGVQLEEEVVIWGDPPIDP